MDDVDQPWRDETRPPPVLSSQISSIKEGDSLSDRTDALTQVIHMEQQLFHVNHLIKEVRTYRMSHRFNNMNTTSMRQLTISIRLCIC